MSGCKSQEDDIYSVHAQDLLQSITAFNAAETAELNAFHAAMFDLIREASNFRFTRRS